MTEVKTYKIEVIVKKKVSKANNHEFVCYACKDKNGKWNDLRFVKEVNEKPVSKSYIYVRSDKINRDTRGQYPVVWVKQIEKIEQIKLPLEDLDQYFED